MAQKLSTYTEELIVSRYLGGEVREIWVKIQGASSGCAFERCGLRGDQTDVARWLNPCM